MSLGRAWYRARQFWNALEAAPNPADLADARLLLPPPLMDLFLRLSPSEQAHSLKVLARLKEQGEADQDLLAAALLHDVGKCLFPLRLWERVAIVLGQSLLPDLARRWGSGLSMGQPPQWQPAEGRLTRRGTFLSWLWRKPFLVAQNHPAWGAALVQKAGGSALTVSLVCRHQEPISLAATPEDILLMKLQSVDDEN